MSFKVKSILQMKFIPKNWITLMYTMKKYQIHTIFLLLHVCRGEWNIIAGLLRQVKSAEFD